MPWLRILFLLDSTTITSLSPTAYQRTLFLKMKLGHTDGGRKLYFVGYTELDDDGHLFYPLEIKVYDIPKRKWMDSIPKLKAPTCYPLVFFIDHWLYVISFDIPEGGQPQPHFEMLNISYLSKGWVSLPLPNTLLYPVVTYKLATLIVDGGHSNETTLYV